MRVLGEVLMKGEASAQHLVFLLLASTCNVILMECLVMNQNFPNEKKSKVTQIFINKIERLDNLKQNKKFELGTIHQSELKKYL